MQILGFGFANPYWFQKIHFEDLFLRPFLKDSFRGLVLWIRFVDSFCGFVFERFVSWIRFAKAKIPNYLICFGRICIQILHP
jgi:hypothetical protein